MAISFNTKNINKNTTSFKSGAPKLTTFNKRWNNITTRAGKLTTAENRLIIGLVAFATQPWIDLFNPDVDKETRRVSFIRTVAKIAIGTATGVSVRWGCIKAMEYFTSSTPKELKKNPIKNKKIATALIPTSIHNRTLTHEDFSKTTRLLSKHRQALGSLIAIVVMMATDPPLTVFLTNFFNKQRKALEAKKAAQEGGTNE